jgi:hypothetical protein
VVSLENKLIIAILLVSLVVVHSNVASACVGARPLAMGASFIGLADDINAVYWNPAGLVQLENTEITWTRTLNNRDIINYDDFLAVGTYDPKSGLAYAVGYINIADYYPVGYTDDFSLVYQDNKIRWFICSLATKLNEQLSIGGNIRLMDFGLRYETEGYWPVADSATFMGVDLSFFYQANEQLSLGLLIQDFNRPKFKVLGQDLYYIRNVRPGIAYRFTNSFLITASIYDLLEEVEMDNRFRVGMEVEVENIRIRAGLDRGNMTLGLGITGLYFVIDYALLGDDLGDTHMLGVIIPL